MIAVHNLERLYTMWLALAMQTAIWAGEDAWDAFDEAVGAVLKKPIREEQARGVYFRCLLRVRSRRFRRQKGVARLSREFLENLPAKPHIAGNFTVGEQTLNDVEKAIATLSPREQRVIRLRYFHGRKPLPYETIGRQEGVRGECIRQLVQRALVRLRKSLEQN